MIIKVFLVKRGTQRASARPPIVARPVTGAGKVFPWQPDPRKVERNHTGNDGNRQLHHRSYRVKVRCFLLSFSFYLYLRFGLSLSLSPSSLSLSLSLSLLFCHYYYLSGHEEHLQLRIYLEFEVNPQCTTRL